MIQLVTVSPRCPTVGKQPQAQARVKRNKCRGAQRAHRSTFNPSENGIGGSRRTTVILLRTTEKSGEAEEDSSDLALVPLVFVQRLKLPLGDAERLNFA